MIIIRLWWIEKDKTGFTLVAPDAVDDVPFDYMVIVKPKTNYGEGRYPQAPGPGFMNGAIGPEAAKAKNQPDRSKVFRWQPDWEVYGYDPADYTKIGAVVEGGPKKGLIKISENEFITQEEMNKRAAGPEHISPEEEARKKNLIDDR